MGAFRHALSLGANGLECDLRLSADGVVFVFHDQELARMTGALGKVSETPSKELLALRLRNPQGPEGESGETPVTLEQLLRELGDKTLLLLEMKSDGGKELPRKVGDLLYRYGLVEEVVVSSFSAEMANTLRARFPGLMVGYEFMELPPDSAVRLSRAPDRHRIIVSANQPELLTPDRLRPLIAAEMATSSFTPNRFDAIQAALDSGIRFIQTDRLDRALLLRDGTGEEPEGPIPPEKEKDGNGTRP
jgi:glycerophosphoryl diester phosphodiesterase